MAPETIILTSQPDRWVDADTIILNPAVGFDIFLPPGDYTHAHTMGGRDHNGFNIGIFFLRVHEWSVAMLSSTLAYPMVHPEVDLGTSPDQLALNLVCNQTEFRANVLYQPRPWYNTYEFLRGYEGQKGDLLVHFPGLAADRFKHMQDWLDIVETDPTAWEVPLEQTAYPSRLEEFWTVLRKGRDLLATAAMNTSAAGGTGPVQAIERLRMVLDDETDRLDVVKQAIEALTVALRPG